MKGPDFSNSKIVVVGDVMLDRYWHGSTKRISPEAPVPVVQVGHVDDRVGGARNVASNVAALSTQATLIGLSGDDGEADELEAILAEAGVKLNC